MKIPFFPNTGDGTHCFQAVLRMALAVCLPEKSFTYDELDAISGKAPGKWTWPTRAMIWMMEQGLTIKLIEDFDYRLFAASGGKYLIDRFGREVGQAQMANSDIEPERILAARFAEMAPIEQRVPALADIRAELGQGAVVIVNVNAAALNLMPGYSGHFVVICEVDENSVTLHDPGMPPRENLTVSRALFESAWAYPSLRDKNLLSIRRLSTERS